MAKGQLHEVLAVEVDLGKIEAKLRQESIKTFDKASLFTGQSKRLEMFDEKLEAQNHTDSQELTTTVDENLEYLVPRIATYWDAVAQKDATNQVANGIVIIDGVEITPALPVTTLLGMENKLSELRKVYEAIPTLPPGVRWLPNDDTKVGSFVASAEEIAFKTEQVIEGIELSPATKEHPAQVHTQKVVNNVGKYHTMKYSGMLTPTEKARRLERIDQMRNAFKQARMRANTAEIVDVHIGIDILKFINGK